MARDRNPDINKKPIAKKWLKKHPKQRRLFIEVLSELQKLYSGDANGYVDLDSPVQYRFNFQGQKEDYLKINAFVRRISVTIKSNRVLKGIQSGKEKTISNRSELIVLIQLIKNNKLTAFNFGEVDVANDIAKPNRVTSETLRIIRDSSLAKKVKKKNNYECQICAFKFTLPNGNDYAEAHHLKPLGEPHNGPDIEENLICLCPNHHAMFDFDSIKIDYDDIKKRSKHCIGETYINYHNSKVTNNAS